MNRIPDEDATADVIVLGAGPSGLAAAGALAERRVGARLLDAAEEPAVAWRGRHEDLRLNTHRRVSGLPGRAMPRSLGAYPRRADFIRYLEDYEHALGLPVERGVRATRIDRAGDAWQIETSAGRRTARHVIVATGIDRVPVLPDFARESPFEGELIHAADFRHARDYAGRRVLIVGAGNSGIDLANHLSRVTLEAAWLSSRSGAHVLPQRILGVPTQPIAVLMRDRSTRFKDVSAAWMARLAFGDLTRFGLATPDLGAFSRTEAQGLAPALDGGFVPMLRSGRIEVVSEVERLEADRALLVDGRAIEPDAVLCATGYAPGLEPLVGHLGVLDPRGRPRNVAPDPDPGQPGLWFLGFRPAFHGSLFARGEEAVALAERIASAVAAR